MTKSSLQKLEDQVEVIESGTRSKKTISLLGRAIRYLSYREHSETELRRKLRPHAQNDADIDATIAKLIEKNYLSTERFVENLVTRKSKSLGINRLVQEMRQHQVDQPTIAKYIQDLRQSEAQRAFEVWEKKFGQLPQDPKELGKQMRFLVSRGFDQEIIYNILRGKTLDESD
jgi:regulatory protein